MDFKTVNLIECSYILMSKAGILRQQIKHFQLRNLGLNPGIYTVKRRDVAVGESWGPWYFQGSFLVTDLLGSLSLLLPPLLCVHTPPFHRAGKLPWKILKIWLWGSLETHTKASWFALWRTNSKSSLYVWYLFLNPYICFVSLFSMFLFEEESNSPPLIHTLGVIF